MMIKYFDGGMGSMLQAKGLALGEYPELAALEHPDWLREIHRAYVEAGSQIIYANTFGANREKLRRTGRTVTEVVSASVALAREAAEGKALVALDLGPIGQLLEPTGILKFEDAVDIFKEMVTAGAAAGARLWRRVPRRATRRRRSTRWWSIRNWTRRSR